MLSKINKWRSSVLLNLYLWFPSLFNPKDRSNRTEDSVPKSKGAKINMGKVFWGIFLVFLVWILTLPWFHWLWFSQIYANLALIGLLITIILVGFFLIVKNKQFTVLKLIWRSQIVLFIVLVIFGGTIQSYLFVKSIDVEKMEKLPDTTNVRYLTLDVARSYGKAKMNDPLYTLGNIEPLDFKHELNYVAARIPNGIWNSFTKNSRGVVIVLPDGQIKITDHDMKYGEGVEISNNIYWQLRKVDYWCDIPEIYYILTEKNELLIMAPYIKYRFEFLLAIPYWAGVFVTHTNGEIENLSPSQAAADPRFVGQRLYPESLAKKIGKDWRYRNGIPNAWFEHIDETELPTISNSTNQMPYLVPTVDGVNWFNGFEPHGKSYSIFKMMFIDAHTGKVKLYELPEEKNLIGPNRALGFIKNAFPNTVWESGGGGTIRLEEPRPIIRGGNLYWMTSVTNTSHSGISRTIFLDANSGKITYFETMSEIKDFLAGKFNGHQIESQRTNLSEKIETTNKTSVSNGLTSLSEQELLDLISRVVDELNKRKQIKK